jgi:hypothetical protein
MKYQQANRKYFKMNMEDLENISERIKPLDGFHIRMEKMEKSVNLKLNQ